MNKSESRTPPTEGLPERLEVGAEYTGAYHDGVELVIPESEGVGEEAVADFIPPCRGECDCRHYDHRALAAEVARRYSHFPAMRAALERALDSCFCDDGRGLPECARCVDIRAALAAGGGK